VWRLVFVLFSLTFGFGFVIYLLLWIFVPEE
jgi:phage shock protein PspC (stress-responsive transcriptional regulator)